MDLALGIDLGTSYFKLGLFDRQGRMLGLGRVPVETTGAARRCELPVERFWSALRAGLGQALSMAGAERSAVRAVSYSSQANTFLLLDSAGEPLTPLVVWSDLRAEPPDPAGDLAHSAGNRERAAGSAAGRPVAS